MKRASYRHAVELVALNDGPGDTDALELEHVQSMISVGLVADLFDLPPAKVARDIIKLRKRMFPGATK